MSPLFSKLNRRIRTITGVIVIAAAALAASGLIVWYFEKTRLPDRVPVGTSPRYLHGQDFASCFKQIYGFDVIQREQSGQFERPPDFNQRIKECVLEEQVLYN